MYNYIKKILLSLSMWIFIWLWILITYAANITSITWTYNSWDTLGIEWFNDIKARLSNIYGSWTNVGIGTVNPIWKLDIQWGRSYFSPSNEQYWIWVKYNSSGWAVYFWATSWITTPDAAISWAWGNTLMTLKNSGLVWIGTTTPSEKLDLWWWNIKMWYEIVTNDCVWTSFNNCIVSCPTWKYVTWGWCNIDNSVKYIYRSYPPTSSQWFCHTQWNLENAGSLIRVYAICANIR
jgi:hypothetical protein